MADAATNTHYAYIVRTPGVVGGEARIAGHRIRVRDIVAARDLGGLTPEEIAANVYPELTLAQVYSALAYYEDHRAEIAQAMHNEAQFVEQFLHDHPQLVRDVRPAKSWEMLRGYADAHVVLALIQALRQRGMDVVRVQDRGREQADDADLLDEALADERVMLTNDTDFLVLAAERGTRQERFAPIFFWPQQRRAIGQLVQSIIREASRHEYDAVWSQVFFLWTRVRLHKRTETAIDRADSEIARFLNSAPVLP